MYNWITGEVDNDNIFIKLFDDNISIIYTIFERLTSWMQIGICAC